MMKKIKVFVSSKHDIDQRFRKKLISFQRKQMAALMKCVVRIPKHRQHDNILVCVSKHVRGFVFCQHNA